MDKNTEDSMIKRVRLQTHVPRRYYDIIKKYAIKDGRNMSQMCAKLIEEAIDTRERRKK
ncbi:CopG antitoxin of type II toxin-antitoxin system [Volucribacter psittacicida]|uniref:CopG antitoxin of type II toxin-antitoxin system n=1 Tax=Volucribacter psittacicida TaxID=203482 RepID=A0A4R1FV45_9PAST|nr:hypothetical protein [Volucribacter psittacicida]TCJ98807.1 CopG antitoxin of type II toxin-antitoxin system [Volucribacter psittacicida]